MRRDAVMHHAPDNVKIAAKRVDLQRLFRHFLAKLGNRDGIMSSVKLMLSSLVLLAACSGNSLLGEDTVTGGGGTDSGGVDGGGIDSTRALPPGTKEPSQNNSIKRFEPKGSDTANGDSGNGYVTDVRYNSANDTFQVDNLAFDGDNTYARGNLVSQLSGYAVYEGKPTVPSGFTGTPTKINQLQHRALYGVSKNGNVEFAIVRTGAYVDYGFGGFIYQRNGSVKLPKQGEGLDENRGQATYSGKYASIRDFKSRGGLEYGTGRMTMDIDFDDFNDGNAVQGSVTNRRVFALNGDDITSEVATAYRDNKGALQRKIPDILFVVGPNVMDSNGEIVGKVTSPYATAGGKIEDGGSGQYYAIVSGDKADQVVGVMVVEGDDPRIDGVGVRETGGFILNRK